jgi:trans-aconitate 2-methyltransferase
MSSMAASADAWNPTQYDRFAAERRQPFDELLRLVRPVPGGRVVDLGCGTGELTLELHRHTLAASTLGIDSSTAMLEKAPTAAGLRFEAADLTGFTSDAPLDVIFANAALQWVPAHAPLLGHLTSLLAPGGQLAIQVPYNHDHASHTTIAAIAGEEPFLSALGGDPPADPVAVNVHTPVRYAELLHELGFAEQHVRMQVFGHVLDSTADVVEWTKGTSLTRFRRRLSDDVYDELVERYRARLVAELGDHRPYFYAFKRILFWAKMPA